MSHTLQLQQQHDQLAALQMTLAANHRELGDVALSIILKRGSAYVLGRQTRLGVGMRLQMAEADEVVGGRRNV